MSVRDTVSTYRLKPEALKDYLERLFNKSVSVNISADGKSFYWFKIPRKLSPEERDHIYDNLRYNKDEDNLWG
ncbi:hypothetical protein F4677DRAFT_409629 [Hypoxylon crocopeplum]|nr:hypothetical protein F4677DRAFT_409629 [Hypoxylon crocopeplum]